MVSALQAANPGWGRWQASPSKSLAVASHQPSCSKSRPTHQLLCAVAADKDTDEVDNEWFLCPMKITHHQGELVTTGFPVENRLIGQVRAAGAGVWLDVLRTGAPVLCTALCRSLCGLAVVAPEWLRLN